MLALTVLAAVALGSECAGGCVYGSFDSDCACVCDTGYEGAACNTDTDSCADSPCVTGTCTDLPGDAGHICTCESAYMGDNCETAVTTVSTGCVCFEDPDGPDECACCAEGACQCGGLAKDTCAICTEGNGVCGLRVAYIQENDPTAVSDDVLTTSGCPCFFDNEADCACCKPERCQCKETELTFNYAIVDLTEECVRCSEDCDTLVDRELTGSWVVAYPELNTGEYGEMVWTVSADNTVSAYYLSGLLPGEDSFYGGDATIAAGTVTKVSRNTYTVSGLHTNPYDGSALSETVVVSDDGLTISVTGTCELANTGCAAGIPGACCDVEGTEGDGTYTLGETGPCWWNPADETCAICLPGGCGCGGPDDEATPDYNEEDPKDTCVPCSKAWRCNPQPIAETYNVFRDYLGVSVEFEDFTESADGCASWDVLDAEDDAQAIADATVVNVDGESALAGDAVNGACCRKNGCQCGIDYDHYIMPTQCVSCDRPQDCHLNNVVYTWKYSEWTDCSQPCAGSAYGESIVGTQFRTMNCTDQFYNPAPDSYCELETDGDDRNGPFPTKDQFDGAVTSWYGGAKPITSRSCNEHACADYTCYKTATQELVSIEPYGANAVYQAITTTENTADNTCPSFFTACHDDPSDSTCAKCLPGGCHCSWEPVKHLCVSCDVGGSACIGSIPNADPFFSWESGSWGGCDEVCGGGVQHRVVTCKGEDGGSYHDSRCDEASMPPREQVCSTDSCADEYTNTAGGCPCWFDLSNTNCGCCRPSYTDGSAGCQLTTPEMVSGEDPTMVDGCGRCPWAVPQTPNPTPAPTPYPTVAPTLSARDDLGGDEGVRRLEGRELATKQEKADEAKCMQCVAGLAPQLAYCNPTAATYLGHSECCGVWDAALDGCVEHCNMGTKKRKLASCTTLITGDKDESTCDACLESKLPGSSDGSDCSIWDDLLPQCAGPCTKDHKNYASCDFTEPASTPVAVVATPESCRRCVFARDPTVSDCMPNLQGQAVLDEATCCQKWGGWLSSCAAECPAPKAECDLNGLVDANLVKQRQGWSPAAECEACVARLPEAQACLSAPSSDCCEKFETGWQSTCRFSCGSVGLKDTHAKLCGVGAGAAAEASAAWALPLAIVALLA